MAKGFAGAKLIGVLLITISLAACSKQKPSSATAAPFPSVQSFPISSSVLTHCHFKDPNPVYTFGAAIPANPVLCDEGAIRAVTLLSPTPLPSGLSFSLDQLSLIGTASEKTNAAPYQFYAENEAGYTILKIQITIK
jgi:hypothetical protein